MALGFHGFLGFPAHAGPSDRAHLVSVGGAGRDEVEGRRGALDGEPPDNKDVRRMSTRCPRCLSTSTTPWSGLMRGGEAPSIIAEYPSDRVAGERESVLSTP